MVIKTRLTRKLLKLLSWAVLRRYKELDRMKLLIQQVGVGHFPSTGEWRSGRGTWLTSVWYGEMKTFLGWRVLRREAILKHRKLLIPASVEVAIRHKFRATSEWQFARRTWPAAADNKWAGEMNTLIGWGALRRERILMRKKLLIPACVQVVGGHFHAAGDRKSGRWA